MFFKRKTYRFVSENDRYLTKDNRAEYLAFKYKVQINNLGIKRGNLYPDYEIIGTYRNLRNLFTQDIK